ncbi:hypothetical protein [Yersinia enterocolitica]|uniref:hypothetical protein n=1 Tax=Yersinia enterocolitica TaxID=630 RepID=UPI0005DC2AAB|nr:hypothetical protein [Yersinia enterocolitica]EKN6064637.1 hypothetical protein [Yersinia enterocolitica]CQQ28486.1 Uncharacterised protein [Yersinia enterocolitica]CRX42396.1 Uncharacterised protein [Yersinia enterocolitica]HDZ9657890.1 hypothetical protein [Yersinia enterocolitica]
MNYSEILSLSNFYLEDSYVLSIDEVAISLIFELEAVLTKNHPQYEEPKNGEQYCYRKVLLRFFSADSIEWLDRRFIGFIDSTGDLDYGNIDSFVSDDGAYILSGDWGRVIIRGGEVEAVITD